MGFRFNRRIKIAPGLTLNVGKRGVSASVGTTGARVTVGSGGVRRTIGIPGTGLSHTEVIAGDDRDRSEPAPYQREHLTPGTIALLLLVALAAFVVLAMRG